jgi:hypothetical protein
MTWILRERRFRLNGTSLGLCPKVDIDIIDTKPSGSVVTMFVSLCVTIT